MAYQSVLYLTEGHTEGHDRVVYQMWNHAARIMTREDIWPKKMTFQKQARLGGGFDHNLEMPQINAETR